jgi:hypothetical protein
VAFSPSQTPHSYYQHNQGNCNEQESGNDVVGASTDGARTREVANALKRVCMVEGTLIRAHEGAVKFDG